MPTAALDAPDRPLPDRVLAVQARATEVDRVDPHADDAFFALTEAAIRLAHADCAHRCSRSCKQRVRCQQDRISARRFLKLVQNGAAQPWAAWVAVAAERVGRSPALPSPTWCS